MEIMEMKKKSESRRRATSSAPNTRETSPSQSSRQFGNNVQLNLSM